VLDRDASGTIEPEEIMNYLIAENGLGEEEAAQLTEEIMSNLDQNNDGMISLEEFSDQYIEIIKKLRYR
jgi:Ca2+-binding EF-hand superfamily protein|tara:strand:+ start:342 stop:548 length:207 start_codon:yes stop_codon:yes gene_type:complete